MTAPQQLRKSRRALLLIDFINPLDFPGAERLARPALNAARAAARLRDRFDSERAAVIYCNDNYGVWRSDFHSLVSGCISRDDDSGEIARLLSPRVGDLALLKPRHSAFFGSPLELLLDTMGTRELALCGLATDICVQLTAADAFLRGYKVWVPADCTAAETRQAKSASLKYMAAILQCDVRSTRSAGAGAFTS